MNEMNQDENSSSNFDVLPPKTMTIEKMVVLLCAVTAAFISELIFNKLVLIVMVALFIICVLDMIAQKKRTVIAVRQDRIIIKGTEYAVSEISVIRITAVGSVYLYCGDRKYRIHVAFRNFERFRQWADNQNIAVTDHR